jgi:DNA-binding NtrC family response regulator
MSNDTTRAMNRTRGTEFYKLAIIDSGRLSFFPLPAHGMVVIGRGPRADVRLDDARVSREHARLHIGESLSIEDLGSANGTLVRNRRIPPWARTEIQPTEGISLGGAVVVVQPAEVEQALSLNGDSGIAENPLLAANRVVVEDQQMKHLYELASRVALGRVSVLVLGETGTGKEVLAETIHRVSTRSRGPFLCVNCAALSESLLESELFGHERGAFTGAHQAKIGLLESASGGTVFLDEIGEMKPSTQAKLLRVLELRELTRVGGVRARAIDVRFVSATNRDLAEEVARGGFRRDLYFRLNAVTLHVPPLRERRIEIRYLAERFLRTAAAQAGMARDPILSAAALDKLERHPWPGNVRELKNVIERAVLLCSDAVLPEHLALDATSPRARPSEPPSERPSVPPGPPLSQEMGFRDEVAALERQRIQEALERFAGNQTRAAAHLGISRRTLIKRLDAYGVSRPRKRMI